MWVSVQYVLLLSQCRIAICCMSFALYNVLIFCVMFLIIHFIFVFLFCMFFFLFCVLCFFLFFFVSPHVYGYLFSMYNFTDQCYQMETQLQLRNIVCCGVKSYAPLGLNNYFNTGLSKKMDGI